eukprot:1253488-Rhodomonas_salina.1
MMLLRAATAFSTTARDTHTAPLSPPHAVSPLHPQLTSSRWGLTLLHGDLETRMSTGGPCDSQNYWAVIRNIALGVCCAHPAGLKPHLAPPEQLLPVPAPPNPDENMPC